MKSDSICRGAMCQVLIEASFLLQCLQRNFLNHFLSQRHESSFGYHFLSQRLEPPFGYHLTFSSFRPVDMAWGDRTLCYYPSKHMEKMPPLFGYYPIPKKLCRLNQQQSFPFLAETSALKLNGGFRFWLWLRSQNVSNRIVIELLLSPL